MLTNTTALSQRPNSKLSRGVVLFLANDVCLSTKKNHRLNSTQIRTAGRALLSLWKASPVRIISGTTEQNSLALPTIHHYLCPYIHD
jgi:hypothetical protein